MPDAADIACIHIIRSLEPNEHNETVEWVCADCGLVFGHIEAAVVTGAPLQFEVWAARNGVPERKVARLQREMAGA